jgi:hypothetical protein
MAPERLPGSIPGRGEQVEEEAPAAAFNEFPGRSFQATLLPTSSALRKSCASVLHLLRNCCALRPLAAPFWPVFPSGTACAHDPASMVQGAGCAPLCIQNEITR